MYWKGILWELIIWTFHPHFPGSYVNKFFTKTTIIHSKFKLIPSRKYCHLIMHLDLQCMYKLDTYFHLQHSHVFEIQTYPNYCSRKWNLSHKAFH